MMLRCLPVALLVPLTVGFPAFGSVANKEGPHPTPDYPKLIRDLRLYVPRKLAEGKVAGASVAIVDGETVVWAEGFGYSNAAHSQNLTADTIFSLQSISKTYTAVLFLEAVDRGWFKLDDPLVKYLPHFRVHSRVGDDEFGRITLRQLLSHWSGLPHEAPVGNNYDDGNSTFEEHIESINRVWLLAPVQSRYAYSNLGYDLLAYLLQMRSQMPFPQYADTHLFRKLRMSATTFDRHKALHSRSFARGQVNGHDVDVLIPMLGAGGLYSSARDMAKFVVMQLADTRTKSGRLLRKETLEEMRTPQFPADHQFAGYGLGIIRRRAFGTVMYSHGGGGYGYDTEQRWFPEYGLGVVVLTNDGGGFDAARTIADHVSEVCVRAKGGLVSPDVPLSLSDRGVEKAGAAELARFEGSYRAYSGMRSFAVVDGTLHYRVGRHDLPLDFRGAGEFTAANERFRFHFDSAGNAFSADDLGTGGVDTFVLNDRPGETPEPDKPEWKQFPGTYTGFSYGEKVPLKIYLQNGYLYASRGGGSKLVEYRRGLFVTVWGESVEFQDDVVLFGNCRFVRERSEESTPIK
jgi:CubicO group peptidase (beta-lactamase class C family)